MVTSDDSVAGAHDSWAGLRASELGDDVGVAAGEKSSAAAVLAGIVGVCLRWSAGVMRGLAALMPRARSIRILGSGVLNFAWVACGRLSAYWEPELAPWDTAAGTLLIEGAPRAAFERGCMFLHA